MRKIMEILLVVLLLPLLIPLVLFALATWLLHGAALNVLVWICWCTRGTHVLLVYSDSPVWHDYIEENIIPRLPHSMVVLNWSQRRTWHWYSLPVMVAETGFLISNSPDTVRAPDAAFVSHQRLATAEPTPGYLSLAPDLVVEVVSPNDTFSNIEARASQWLAAGTRIVLVVDPANLTLQVYQTKSEIRVLRPGDTFSAGNVCGDWQLTVNDAFQIKN